MFMYWILEGRVILILVYILVTLEFADGFINVYETTYKCGKFLVAATTSERSGTSMDKSSHVEREWGRAVHDHLKNGEGWNGLSYGWTRPWRNWHNNIFSFTNIYALSEDRHG
jgi:hypothetical protein